jgi:hypothetical protein
MGFRWRLRWRVDAGAAVLPGRPTHAESDEPFHGIYTTLLNKYWVDEIYDALIVNRTKGLGTLARFDLVSLMAESTVGLLTRTTASLSACDFWVVDFAVAALI